MIHWCGEETAAVMSAVPFLGIVIAMFRRNIKRLFGATKKLPKR